MIAIGFLLAAAVGGLLRWQAARWNDRTIPLGTLGINLVTAFTAGLSVEWSAPATTVFVVGFLGATSTFSTFVGEFDDRLSDGRHAAAVSYLVTTLIGGVAAAWLALSLTG